MYRANFYGQSAFLTAHHSNLMIRHRVLDRLPDGPGLGLTNSGTSIDLFSGPTSRFETTLHQEVVSLNQRTRDLEKKIKNTKLDELSAQEQQSIMREYSLIQRTKEMLTLIVDNMQKCAANIAANFR